MGGVRAAARAVLVQLHAVWIVAAVLLGDAVGCFAISARKRDLWSYIGRLAIRPFIAAHCVRIAAILQLHLASFRSETHYTFDAMPLLV